MIENAFASLIIIRKNIYFVNTLLPANEGVVKISAVHLSSVLELVMKPAISREATSCRSMVQSECEVIIKVFSCADEYLVFSGDNIRVPRLVFWRVVAGYSRKVRSDPAEVS